MTEITHLDSSQMTVPDPPVKGGTDHKHTGQGKDWFLILLAISGILTLLAALAVGMLLLLRIFLPVIDWQLDVLLSFVPLLIPTIGNVTVLQIGTILLAGLLLLDFVIYLLARWRILRKHFLWPAAGCPSCEAQLLLRVHRRRKDRLYTWIGIPVGRYQCRECRWNGLRIRRGMQPSTKEMDWTKAVTAMQQSTPSPTALTPTQDSGDVVAGTESDGATAKWTARLYDPVATAAATRAIQEAIVDVEETMPAAEEAAPAIEEETPGVAAPLPSAEEAASAGEGTTDEVVEAAPADEEPASNGTPTLSPFGAVWPGDEPSHEPDLARDRGLSSTSTRGEVVAPFGLNLRENPQTDGVLLDVLEPGTNVRLLDRVMQQDGAAWQQVQVNNQKGWVKSAFLKNCE